MRHSLYSFCLDDVSCRNLVGVLSLLLDHNCYSEFGFHFHALFHLYARLTLVMERPHVIMGGF